MSEINVELPAGWEEVPIGSLCELINGRAFKPNEWGENGLKIIRIQNLNNPFAKYNYFDGDYREQHLVSPVICFLPGQELPVRHLARTYGKVRKRYLINISFGCYFQNSIWTNRIFVTRSIANLKNSLAKLTVGWAYGM